MAYATPSNVQDEFKNVDFTDVDGRITTTKVTEWIAQTEAYINAKISSRYAVPVTSTDATPLLKMISIAIVKCRIEKILAVKAPVDPNRQATDSPDCNKRWDDMLDKIASGKLPLPGAEVAVGGGGWDSYTYQNDIETDFDVTENNW